MDVNVKDCSLRQRVNYTKIKKKKHFNTDEYFDFEIPAVKLQFINRASTAK